jgi:hypothetical protein
MYEANSRETVFMTSFILNFLAFCCKVVYSVSAPVSVWPLERDISIPVNTGRNTPKHPEILPEVEWGVVSYRFAYRYEIFRPFRPERNGIYNYVLLTPDTKMCLARNFHSSILMSSQFSFWTLLIFLTKRKGESLGTRYV